MSELGDLLRSAREERRLSIDDVSRMTRIKARYLEALEMGDFNQIPGHAYVTGFLRNYAIAVGLHPDDVIQEYHALRPTPTPTVKPATRVLANGHSRHTRKRILWSCGGVFLLLSGGFAVKQYNDTYAHPYSPPNITPPNLGNPNASVSAPVQPAAAPAHQFVRVALQPLRRAWVRVSVDGHVAFQGVLQPIAGRKSWRAQHSIYVLATHGPRLLVTVNGRPEGLLAHQPGLVVQEATPNGWQRVA